MDVDSKDMLEQAATAAERRSKRLNAVVAVTVALLATFMGICKVKDDNIVQAMQQAQADRIDLWSFYQARNLRQEVAEATVVQLELARAGTADKAAYDTAIARFRELAAEQARKKAEVKAQAEEAQRLYDRLNYRDDQFDLSDALLAIAIAMLAVTALTGTWALYWVALVPTLLGVLMGVAGLAGLQIHPESIVKLLS